jgi:hypothetical protein
MSRTQFRHTGVVDSRRPEDKWASGGAQKLKIPEGSFYSAEI